MSNGEHKTGEERTTAQQTQNRPGQDPHPDAAQKSDVPDRQQKVRLIKQELVARGLTPEMAATATANIEGIIWGS
jgi:hypothetical protein